MKRRTFLTGSGIAASASAFSIGGLSRLAAQNAAAAGDEPARHPILLSVKSGMVNAPGLSIKQKLELLKELGYDGVEMNSPGGADKAEALKASQETGVPIHGVVDSIHWSVRLSDPDAAVREKALQGLLTAIRETHQVRGSAVLLVPGKVDAANNENHDQVWKRSIDGIRQALPLAAKLGVHILIENVWNEFLYDVKGGEDQTADQLCKYLDEINSPWVGSYFDIGNHQRFAKPEKWIRQLGKRIVKLDVKDWGKKNGFCKIGDGDVNWPGVRTALKEIGFTGWATAEVGGGNKERLAEILKRMRTHLLGVESNAA